MCVFVREVIRECVRVHCLGSNNRLSVPISEGGAPETWLHCVIGCEKFTLEGAVWWIFFFFCLVFFFLYFQLNVECRTLEGHLKCAVFLHVYERACACMCVYVCLSP